MEHCVGCKQRRKVLRRQCPECPKQSTFSRSHIPRFEGPTCELDINECVRGTAGCAKVGAACVNTVGGYSCSCVPGVTGDGLRCTRSQRALDALRKAYTPSPKGKIACDEGKPVAYPLGAPGFAYDPIGAGNSSATGGSSVSVTDLGCMAACDMAPGCTAFSYNPVMHQCFLKAKPSTKTCKVGFAAH